MFCLATVMVIYGVHYIIGKKNSFLVIEMDENWVLGVYDVGTWINLCDLTFRDVKVILASVGMS